MYLVLPGDKVSACALIFLWRKQATDQEGRAPVLLMLDIDRFRHINDQYGHEIRDQILMAATRKVQSPLGVEKIRQKMDEISNETESGSIGTSVSNGTTGFIKEGNAYTYTVKRADQAMYQYKRQGKSKWTWIKK